MVASGAGACTRAMRHAEAVVHQHSLAAEDSPSRHGPMSINGRHIPGRFDCDWRKRQRGRPRSAHPRPGAGVEQQNASHSPRTS